MPPLRTTLCILLLLNAALQAATPVVPDDAAAVQRVMAQLKEIRSEVQGRPIDAALTRGGFTVLTSEPQFEIVFAEGWGDCESGCINHRYTYFVVTPEGTVQQAGEYGNIKADDVVSGEPMWGVPSLAKSEVTDDVEKLKEYALSPQWWLREYALRSFGASGDKIHAGIARDALKDKHPRVRIAAVEALWIFGGDENMRALLALLEDPRPEVRRQVLYSLEKATDPQIFAGLLPYLKSADPATVDIVFGTLATARYLPALNSLNDLVERHADFTPEGVKHLGERLFHLAEWARPESVPAFIQALKFTDEAYEAALVHEDEHQRFMTEYGMFYGTALTGLARVSGESVDDLLPLSITPRDRRRIVTHWEEWWEQHGPAALANAERESKLQDIQAILADRDNPRQSAVLEELRRKLISGSIHITDVASVLLRHQADCKLWNIQEKEAVQWLAHAAGGANTQRSRSALSVLRSMGTLESWRALLKCRSNQDVFQDMILQDAWSLCAGTVSQGAKLREKLKPELRELIEAALRSGFYKSSGTAQTLAGLEHIPFDAAAVQARVNAEQKAHPFDEFSTQVPKIVDRARRHDPELKQELLAMLGHPQRGFQELALYELMRRYAYTPSTVEIISQVHSLRSIWYGGLSRPLLDAASACEDPKLLLRMQEVLRDDDRSEPEERCAFWILCAHGVVPDPVLCENLYERAVRVAGPDDPNAADMIVLRKFRPPGFTSYLQRRAARFARHEWPHLVMLLHEFDPPSAEAAVARSLKADTSGEQAEAAALAGKLKLQRLRPELNALAAPDELPALRAVALEALAAMPAPELEADLVKDAAGSRPVRRAAQEPVLSLQQVLETSHNPPGDLSYHTIVMVLTSPEIHADAAMSAAATTAALDLQDDYLLEETHAIMDRLSALRDARVEPLAKRWMEDHSLQWEGTYAVRALLRIDPAKYTQQALNVLGACRDDDAHVLLQQIRRYCGTEIVPGLRAWVAQTPQRESLKNDARDAINALLQK